MKFARLPLSLITAAARLLTPWRRNAVAATLSDAVELPKLDPEPPVRTRLSRRQLRRLIRHELRPACKHARSASRATSW